MNTELTAQEIADAWSVAAMACTTLWAAQYRGAPYAERAALRQRTDDVYQGLNDLQDAARRAFANTHGFRHVAKESRNYNYPVLDHADSFVDAKGKRVARVTHSYTTFENIARFAKANDLIAQRLSWSWWNPRPSPPCPECIAVLLMPATTNEVML
jgi:hypothetical protein